MYLNHFSLNIKPFQITADPKFLWLGEKHKEALATLRYGIIDNRGFLLLTGEVGTGKTILINRLITLLDLDTVVATLPDPDLESMDFYNLLADGFNMKRTFEGKGEFLIHLRDFLHQSHANRQQVLLIIDESQRLNHRLMEDIRVLSNIELHDRKLINIFFVGQQEFNSILMTPQNRALSQRITVRYHIETLDENETGEYIHHRLQVAGSTRRIFKKSAVGEVFRVAGGIPRLINIVCDHAMLTAYAQGVQAIDDRVIRECAEELRIPIQKPLADAATVKAAGEPPANGNLQTNRSPKTDGKPIQNTGGQPIKPDVRQSAPAVWRLVYAAFILILIGGFAFFVTRYTVVPTPRYNEEDLTPQKYKNTLEMEKARLEDRLSNGEVADQTTERSVQETVVDERRPLPPAPIEKQTTLQADAQVVQATTAMEEGDDVPQRIEPLPLLKEKAIIGFDINSNEIEQTSYLALDQIAEYMVAHPEVEIFVRGYTDSSGSPGYNESVSRFRASAAKSYLIGKGAPPDRIKVFAMGAANPIASNNTFEGRKKNRRVEIEFRLP